MFLLIGLLIVTVIAVTAIPTDVWSLIGENCVDRRGHLKFDYAWREMLAVGNFFAGFLLGAFVLAILILAGMIFIDTNVIPIHLAAEAIEQADANPSVWKERMSQGNKSVSQKYAGWHVANGGSMQEAGDAKQFLWNAVPIAVVIAFTCVIFAARLSSIGYAFAMDQLVEGAAERNRDLIAKRYLDTTVDSVKRSNSLADRDEHA